MKHIHRLVVICFLLIHTITCTHTENRSHSKLRLHSKSKDKHKSIHQSIINELVPGLGSISPAEQTELDNFENEAKETIAEYKSKKNDPSPSSERYQDWFTISSSDFRNQNMFPVILTADGTQQEIGVQTSNFQRVNFFNFKLLPRAQRPPMRNIFFVPKKGRVKIYLYKQGKQGKQGKRGRS